MSEFFRGYVITKNKKCLMPFKNVPSDQLLDYESASKLNEYAGILAEDAILVDVDDREQAETLMNIVDDQELRCRVYDTDKGRHFLFKNDVVKNCGNSKKLACGLVADIKAGCRNSYSILKVRGKERPIDYDKFDDEEYETLPAWLRPVNYSMDFLTMSAGDGRNQALFNYILTLQSNGFTKDECRQTIRIINQYVLKEPLEDSEIETILRDDAFEKPIFFSGKTFLFDKFANFLKNNNHIVKISGQLHIYCDGIYVADPVYIESEMIRHIPNLSKSKRMEVMAYLELLVRDNVKPAPAHYIAFKNGVYDLHADQLLEFNPDIIITNKIPWDFVHGAYDALTDKTLNKMACQDDQIRALMDEFIGYCFYRRNELRQCAILTGERQNGKSTFLSMLIELLGSENVATLDLKEIGHQFKTAELFNKLANVGDDIEEEFISSPAVFKKIVSGNPVTVEQKGRDPFTLYNYSKLIFSANTIPRIRDRTGAVLSRMTIIPFDAKFTRDDPDFDPYIKYKLIQQGPMEYLIQAGIKGLKRVLENQGFTKANKVQKSLKEYEESNNPILLFFRELDECDVLNEPTNKVFRKYSEFCVENSFTPMSNIEFSKQVKKFFDVQIKQKSIKGKKYRIFVETEE